MELLGSKSESKDAVNVLTNIAELNRHLLTSDVISDADVQTLIEILSLLADTKNDKLLHNSEVSSLILLLMENENSNSVPVIRNLILEVKLRTIRTQCLNITDSSLTAITEDSCTSDTPEDIDDYFGISKEERFLPTPDNNFVLPAPGEVTNLTVTEPNNELGKNLIRELMINSEGFVVQEVSRRYEDIYTDESEEIYNNAYLSDIKGKKKSEEKEQNFASGLGRSLN